jgi:hypothetical protein
MSLPENIEKYTDGQISWLGGVGKGWFPLVEELHKTLVEIDPEYEIHQIKEKFGGLRYYFGCSKGFGTPESAAMQAAVRLAEGLSIKTCENCGRPGELRHGRHGRGWTLCLCDECHAKRD